MASDMQTYGEARHAGPVLQSYLGAGGSLMGGPALTGVPLPTLEGLPTPGAWGGGGAGPHQRPYYRGTSPQERPCIEAVMDYLEGPSVSSHLASLLGCEAPSASQLPAPGLKP
jgi:hypothetical protein